MKNKIAQSLLVGAVPAICDSAARRLTQKGPKGHKGHKGQNCVSQIGPLCPLCPFGPFWSRRAAESQIAGTALTLLIAPQAP